MDWCTLSLKGKGGKGEGEGKAREVKTVNQHINLKLNIKDNCNSILNNNRANEKNNLTNKIVVFKEAKDFILNPILLVEDVLFTPLSLNDKNVLEAISTTAQAYSDFFNFVYALKLTNKDKYKEYKFNLVLYFLKMELDKNIIICGKPGYLHKDRKLSQLNSYFTSSTPLHAVVSGPIVMGRNYQVLSRNAALPPAAHCVERTGVSLGIRLAGVYAFIHKNNKDCYIGSSIDISSRYKNHKYNFKKSTTHFALYLRSNNGLNDFNFGMVYLTTNYFLKFTTLFPNYKLSKGEGFLLYSLTELHIKILEQTMITRLKPNLNGLNYVSFNNLEWRKEWLNKYFDLEPDSIAVSFVDKPDSTEIEYKKSSSKVIKKSQYKKQTKINIFTKLTEREIKLLPENIKSEYENIETSTFKKSFTVNDFSKKYNISKDIIYENLNTLNYVNCEMHGKVRFQEENTEIKNVPLPYFIS